MLRLDKKREFIEALDTALPVVRIFGSTEEGQRAMVHLHGAFPYFYFRPLNVLDNSFENEGETIRYLGHVEDRLNQEMGKKKQARRRYIHRLEYIRARQIYGFYPDPQGFIKVSIRDPSDMATLVSMLEVSWDGMR